jgi:Uri superfamily endonuclease
VLILELGEKRRIEVGRLGTFLFVAGWYCYVGSAFGPGGVAARCNHHRRISPRPHWHIDHLRARCRLQEIWYSHDPEPLEHQWAELLGAARGARMPVPGFGASDCACPSHLWYFSLRPGWSAFVRRSRMKLPGRPGLKREVVSTEEAMHV